MMKKMPESQKLKLGDAPDTLKKYSRRLKRLSLGMPPVHPLLHQQSSIRPSPHYIFITSCVMCYAWSVLHLLFSFALFSLVLFAVHNKLDPSMPCLGEKHAPLLPRLLIIFIPIFVECSF